ncbi:hydroxyacid dehydrogenase [Clostridium tyrobutyricum]|uniref:hydroxyacid dehydrogenase n=1 Tax=Clostridium tyrobutyricum TaxID=1519 RepID=UPI0030CBCA10
MSYKVLITEDIDVKGKNYLKEQGCEIKTIPDISEETLIKNIKDCDAVLTRNAIINEKVIKSAKKLKVISMHGVGVDIIDVDAATKYGIQVTNAPESNKNSVAEYTIGLIIALSKNLLTYDKELRKGNFQIRKVLGMDLEGKTLGVIGMGNIGTLVAKKASNGLNMKVIGFKRCIKNVVPMNNIELTSDIDYLLKNSDFVTLHVPLTDGTKKLLGKRELDLMRSNAFLINTARGEVVDNDALVDALSSKKIAGSAIDVFEGEIPTKDNPLLSLDNVIVSPHTAAFTTETIARMSLHSAMGIAEVLNGKEPTWPVNTIKDTLNCLSAK